MTPWPDEPGHLQPPTLREIGEAASRLRHVIVDTPLLESGRLNRRPGGCALIKDAFALPCSDGGLAAGCDIALAEVAPGTELLVVGPEGFDDTLRSLAACPLLSNTGARWSVCDAWLAPSPGRLTFAVNRQHGTKAVAVADDSTRMAVAALVAAFGLVAEPGGAIALGRSLRRRIDGARADNGRLGHGMPYRRGAVYEHPARDRRFLARFAPGRSAYGRVPR